MFVPSHYSSRQPPTRNSPVTALNISSERKRRLGCGTLVPTLVVFILTFGAGFGILVWLYIKRRIPLTEAFRAGYILVDEGVEGEVESATLRALTAISFIVR
jgi:hypothetical protein